MSKNLLLNTQHTHIMLVDKGKERKEDFVLDGENIEEVERFVYLGSLINIKGTLSLSLGAVSNSDVGGHGFPLFSVPCSFDDLDFTDSQQLAEAFHEVQPWSSSASLALNFPSDYDVLKSMLSHDMSQETHLPRSDSVHQFPLCSSSPQYLIICDMVLPRYV